MWAKTYLAAFDSRKFKRVLFIAHREEILAQAQRIFARVRPESSSGFFTGRGEKMLRRDLCFATIPRRSAGDEHLRSFPGLFRPHCGGRVPPCRGPTVTGKVLGLAKAPLLLGADRHPLPDGQPGYFRPLRRAMSSTKSILGDSINRDLLTPFLFIMGFSTRPIMKRLPSVMAMWWKN